MAVFSDEEWAETEKELPRATDAVVQKYLEGRAGLVAQEARQRSDHAFRQALSPVARRACAIADRVRVAEKERVWTPQLEEAIAAREAGRVTVHPGMMFGLAKDTMETTELWRIVRRMPKGALLHAHNDAMVDYGFLIGAVLDTPGMHMACPDSHLADDAARRDRTPVFRFLRATPPAAEAMSIWSADGYVPGTFVPADRAADSFPGDGGGGGRAAFTAWLKSRVTISRTDSTEQHHGQDHIWAKFMRCFEITGSMLHYEPVFRAFLRRVMALLHADGVAWAELRHTWPLDYRREGREEAEEDYMHMFSVIDDEVGRFRARHPSFWGLRMIWSSHRAAPARSMAADMVLCVETKRAFPHLVAGYDVVGQEDKGPTLRSLFPILAWFRKLCAEEGVSVPFFFHAGETLGDGDGTDGNLFDAVLLGTRRLGHGFSLYKHPLLVELVKERRILVESCPISNEVLRLCSSVLAHPLPALLARGVPCALSNDDPGMLGHDTAGATHDFWQALQGWENLGLAGLGSLAENSVRWAAFEDEDDAAWLRGIREASLGDGVKAQRLKEWAVAWEEFCLWVVTEYGDRYPDEDEAVDAPR